MNKQLIQNLILCLIMQIILCAFVLEVFFNHEIIKAIIESTILQTITTIAGIIFYVMLMKKL